MSDIIDYYFTVISPFTFLGHDALHDVAAKRGRKISYKPFNLFGVWEISGALPPMKRPPARQRYRIIELQRIAEMRGLPINLQPTHWPTDPSLADHCAIAIVESGGDPASFIRAAGKAVWQDELQIAEEAVIGKLLDDTGHDSKAIRIMAGLDTTAEIRAANTRAAIEADAVGAPAYVYRGEVFWGQDRIDYLDRMIASGRESFTA